VTKQRLNEAENRKKMEIYQINQSQWVEVVVGGEHRLWLVEGGVTGEGWLVELRIQGK
jgi:hypothetical protein